MGSTHSGKGISEGLWTIFMRFGERLFPLLVIMDSFNFLLNIFTLYVTFTVYNHKMKPVLTKQQICITKGIVN